MMATYEFTPDQLVSLQRYGVIPVLAERYPDQSVE
jgi:hypothetical protein